MNKDLNLAASEKEEIQDVWNKIKDPNTYVIAQTAPAVRVALGEEFGMEIGTNVTGKMISALKGDWRNDENCLFGG